MQRLVITILFLVFGIVLSAQDQINPKAKSSYRNAVTILTEPNPSQTNVDKALVNLKNAYAIDSLYTPLLYYMGLTYYHLEEFETSYGFLEKYKGQTRDYHKDFNLYYGIVSYKLSYDVVAQEYLQFYISSYSGGPYKDSLAMRTYQLSKQSQTLMTKVLPSKKEFISSINTDEFDEYYPILTPDRKHILFNRLTTDPNTGKQLNKIYDYNLDLPPGEMNPKLLPINNIQDKEFIITSMSSTGKKILLVSKDKRGNHDVYESEWMVMEWGIPQLMYSQINSVDDEKFATYGHNDSLIYIISNRPGGYGGYDIWKIRYNSRYIHESLINLGPQINTEYNENYISCVTNSNLIFFTSEGHLCMGNSDIFRTKLEYGQYTRPINLGYPINSTGNEATFFVYPTANMGLTEIKNKTKDIYITYLPPKAKKPGYVLDQDYLNSSKLRSTLTIVPTDE